MKKLRISFLFFILFSLNGHTQKLPYSVVNGEVLDQIEEINLNSLRNSTLSNDSINLLNFTFAKSYTKINLSDKGTWIKNDEDQWIWIMAASSRGAKYLNFDIENLKLLEEDKLFIYTKNDKLEIDLIQGEQKEHFESVLLKGDKIYIEYKPIINDTNSYFSSKITLNHIFKESLSNGFGTSDDCEINANCNSDSEKQYEKRSTVRIRTKKTVNGQVYLGYCTGTLIATTERNFEPYIITADHCLSIYFNGNYIPASDEDLDDWLFYFNYESETCEDPDSENQINFTTQQGASLLANSGGAGDDDSDFCLVELNNPIAENTNAFWAGWDINDYPTRGGYAFHHPSGDIKKINTFTSTTESTQFDPDGPENTHWKVEWDTGVTEGGSSGSSLLNIHGQIIGILTGGQSQCGGNNLSDIYGKMARSYVWDSSSDRQLKHWINPNNEEVDNLSGYDKNFTKSIEYEDKISFYPNPVTQNIINFGNIDPSLIDEVVVHSINGSLIWRSTDVKQNYLELDLNQGIYFIETTYNGKKEISKLLFL